MTDYMTQVERKAKRRIGTVRSIANAALREVSLKSGYLPMSGELPEGVRMDVTRHTAGQICQTYYGGYSRWEHGPGDPYMMTVDRSEPGSERLYAHRAAPEKLRCELTGYGSNNTMAVELRLGDIATGFDLDVDEIDKEVIQREVQELAADWNAQFAD